MILLCGNAIIGKFKLLREKLRIKVLYKCNKGIGLKCIICCADAMRKNPKF